MMGQKTLAAQIADGTTKTEGNIVILGQLAAKLVTLEMGFEILPGSAGPAGEVDLDPHKISDSSSRIQGG